MTKTERLGQFYLGKRVEKKGMGREFLLDSKNFTTHAVCVGMTGSGKTGLGIALLEEAALNQIPAIIIDPKGDLSNLLLTFPYLSPAEFLPWVDPGEAARKGMETTAYSETVAKTWQEGLDQWGEGADRIQKLRQMTDIVAYTPASQAGVPLSILSSFAAPSKELMQDSEAVRDRILSLTSSLLGLLGISADPIKSREHILIATLISKAWEQGKSLDLPTLIQQVQKPPFDKIGALDIDTFFSQKERNALSISLNNLLASPSFQAWLEGDPLDIQQLLYNKEGKPKLAILSIAHLSDSERMFFVTLLLNEVLSWMRRQPGTSNLKALLYMDEIYGFFPPTSMPPSKIPMLTLLKQARAYGLGITLVTQNPVDLDYKGLSNCGMWFIGKLQTERDKTRVLEGLKIASNGELDAAALDKMIAATGNRIFLLRSVYEKDPLLFETRWTLSYLRGPLTLEQIGKLTDKSQALPKRKVVETTSQQKPLVSAKIEEFFVRKALTSPVHYKPRILGIAKLHFIDTKNKIDEWQTVKLAAMLQEGAPDWEKSEALTDEFDKTPLPNSSFDELPAEVMNEKNFASFEKNLLAYLYQTQTLTLYQASKILSKIGETETEFRQRIANENNEKAQAQIAKIKSQYAGKELLLNEKVKRAEEKLSERKQKTYWQVFDALLSFLTALLGAFTGRKITKGTISQTGTSIRRAGRIGKDSQSASQAEESYQSYQQQLDALHTQMNQEIAAVTASANPQALQVDPITLRPRKSDIAIEKLAIVWVISHSA